MKKQIFQIVVKRQKELIAGIKDKLKEQMQKLRLEKKRQMEQKGGKMQTIRDWMFPSGKAQMQFPWKMRTGLESWEVVDDGVSKEEKYQMASQMDMAY